MITVSSAILSLPLKEIDLIISALTKVILIKKIKNNKKILLIKFNI
jgi:hypothetical protein